MEKTSKQMQQEDHDRLVGMEAKIDTLLLLFHNIEKNVSDHETRLRSLEKQNTSFSGTIKGLRVAGGFLIVIVGFVEPVILYFLNKGQ